MGGDEDDGTQCFDNTVDEILDSLCESLSCDKNDPRNRLDRFCNSMKKWAATRTCQQSFPNTQRFFYLYYSVVLHLGAASQCSTTYSGLNSVNTSSFLTANRSFIEGCSRLASAIDINKQILAMLLEPTSIRGSYNEATESFSAFDEKKMLRSVRNLEPNLSDVSFGEMSIPVNRAIEMLRNKQVHRTYTYVLPIVDERTRECSWYLLSPTLSCNELDMIRQQARNHNQLVNTKKNSKAGWSNPWAQTASMYFFPNTDKDNGHARMEASQVLVCLQHYLMRLLEFTTAQLDKAASNS